MKAILWLIASPVLLVLGLVALFQGVNGSTNLYLLNQDYTPALNPVPPGWMGWISVAAGAGVPSGSHCCFSVNFVCDGVPATIICCSRGSIS